MHYLKGNFSKVSGAGPPDPPPPVVCSLGRHASALMCPILKTWPTHLQISVSAPAKALLEYIFQTALSPQINWMKSKCEQGSDSCCSCWLEIWKNAGNQWSMTKNLLQISLGKYIFSERWRSLLSENIYFPRPIRKWLLSWHVSKRHPLPHQWEESPLCDPSQWSFHFWSTMSICQVI